MLWPAKAQVALGAVKPFNTHDFQGCVGQKKKPQARPLVSVKGSGEWLVAMTLSRNGTQHPTAAAAGKGCCQQTVTIGALKVGISGTDIKVSS